MNNFFLLPEVDTPTVVVDESRLNKNIRRWASNAANKQIFLRPHAKTHKSPTIALKQLEAGASGITVATLSEAQIFAASGITNIFQAYPLWLNKHKEKILRELHETNKMIVGIDSTEGATRLANGVKGMQPLSVMVEVDSGQHRTGVPADKVVEVTQHALAVGLEVVGVFTHGGHVYGTAKPAEAASDEENALTQAKEKLAAAGIHIQIVSSGSTPTASFHQNNVTEQRPGVYIFGDFQQISLGVCGISDVSLAVVSTVVSIKDNRFVLDAGSKSLGMDKPSWLNSYGFLPAYPDSKIERLSEHHAVVTSEGDTPTLGEQVAVVPNHVCNTVNLFDKYVVSNEGNVVDVWPIAARGCNV